MWAGTGTEGRGEEIGIIVRSSTPPRRAVKEWPKNLHGSKTILKSQFLSYRKKRCFRLGLNSFFDFDGDKHKAEISDQHQRNDY